MVRTAYYGKGAAQAGMGKVGHYESRMGSNNVVEEEIELHRCKATRSHQ
jgi:hypothetical protein